MLGATRCVRRFGGYLVLAPQQGEQSHEDIQHIEVDLDGAHDGVAHGAFDPHGAVQVEDDEACEEEHTDPVPDREGALDGDADCAGEEREEVAEDQHQECSEEP